MIYILFMICMVAGCASSELHMHATAAHKMAAAVNHATDISLEVYEAEQKEAIKRACPRATFVMKEGKLVGTGDTACLESAARGRANVRVKWAPVWTLHNTARRAHDRWVDAIEKEQGGITALAVNLSVAYQELLSQLRRLGVSLPKIPHELLRITGDREGDRE